ncbi:MAG: haloacid dehalogenase type II [Solirubrobacteraceae bacterium]
MLIPAVVALDVNETLSDMSALSGRLEAAGISGDVVPTWFAQTLRDGFALAAAGAYAEFAAIAGNAMRSLVAGLPDLAGNPDELSNDVVAAMSELPVHEDVTSGLRRLHEAGIRLVTLTNGSAKTARKLLENADLAGCIEQFLSVDAIGRWKPAPESYRFAADTCEVSAEQVMLVAAHPWDVDGAKRAGLAAAWINRSATVYPEFFSAPDLTCTSFDELADALSP